MIFHFSTFILNEENCTLTKNHQPIDIEPKIFALLCYFCRNPQRAISREELIENVWQGRIVSNAAINRAVGELRKAIELDVKSPQYIVTISKVGYQFSASISQPPPPTVVDSTNVGQTKIINPIKKPKSDRRAWRMYAVILTLVVIALFVYINNKPVVEGLSQFNVSAASPLTTIKGSPFKPHIFENGQAVFLHRDGENKNVQLWLQAPGLAATQLTNDSYYYTYAIYADADTIFATRFDNLEERNCQIIKLSILSKQSEIMTNCAKRAMTHLAFDNGSRKLYFNYRESVSQPYAIRSLQIDTGRMQQVTHASPSGNSRGDSLFALSPNGKKLAILEYQQDGTAMLKATNMNKPMNVERYESYFGVSGISWFNDSTVIITEEKGIVSYNFASAKSEYIVKGEQIAQAVFSPSLSLLSYVKFDATQNIYRRLLHNSEHEEAITHSAYINVLPNYANTSNALVYFSTDSGKWEVQLLDEMNIVTTLTFPETIKHYGNLTWTSDDSSILASINSKLFQYSLEERVWREINIKLKNIHYVEAIHSMQAIVSSEHSGDWQLWQVDLNSQEATQITKRGGYSASYMPFKNTVIFSKYSEEGLFELNLKDHSEVTIKEDFKITHWNKWQVRNKHLYSWENKSIVKMNLLTDEKSIAWQLSENNPSHFSINFDGSKLAYKVVEQEKSTIWKRSLVEKSVIGAK